METTNAFAGKHQGHMNASNRGVTQALSGLDIAHCPALPTGARPAGVGDVGKISYNAVQSGSGLLTPSLTVPNLQRRCDALEKELDRTKLIYGELLHSMEAEVTRLSNLLLELGVDCDGNPLENDANDTVLQTN